MEPETNQQQPVTTGKTDAVLNDLRINNEWLITLALAFFFGIFGVHRFYNGKIGTGVLMIFTLGGLGIWALIDLIIILFGGFKTKDGKVITVRIPAQQ